MSYLKILQMLPEVAAPLKKQSLKQRLMWTGGILVLFLFLAAIPLFGVNAEQASYFQHLELLLGAKIGKLLTLGIGPIVTASIVLQLLKGAQILKFDLTNEEGKFIYSGSHKLLTFAFILIESIVYVAFGAVTAQTPDLFWLVAIQLALGGLIVVYMDEVVKKWGIGSGVSLFIAAGIGQAVFLQLFSPFTQTGEGSSWLVGGDEIPIGKVWAGMYYLSHADPTSFLTAVLGPIGITIGLFLLIVFFQSINVEIPLSFGRVRGQSMKWPLNFFYAGVIPVILISALSANFNLWSSLWEKFKGMDPGSSTLSSMLTYIQPLSGSIWTNLGNLFTIDVISHILSYTIFMVIGATVFSYFWVQTSGMDSKSQAKQILNSGLQIPGFRKDARIIERVLERYIIPLTLLGGIGIGLLASIANLLGALTSGTGILLMIMIIYQFYKTLARESMEDFSLLQKLMRK